MTPEEAKQIIETSGLTVAAHNDLPKVQQLLDAQPELVEAMNLLIPKAGDDTPQRAAAHARQIDILRLFIERGVNTDLFMACALGQTSMVDAYLTAHPKEVDAKGAHGIPLMVHANHPEMVELLIKRGADPTLALQQVTWSGRIELMEVALAHGAKADPIETGRRPLHIAAHQGHKAAVELLLKHGADPNSRSKGADWERKNAIALAIMNNHTEVAALLRPLTKFAPQPVRRPGPPRGQFRPRR